VVDVSELEVERSSGHDARHAVSDAARGRIQRALKLSQIFDKATRASREAATAVAALEVAPGGTVIMKQGAQIDSLIILGRGRARLERVAADGRAVPLGYRGSGDVLSESCFGSGRLHTESAIAMEEVEAIRVPMAAVNTLIATDSVFASAVMALLVARQRETEERIESMLFRNVEGRLAEFLLKAADRWGVPTPKGTLISAPITHLEIAQAIGSTRETVTLTLGALRREGLLDVAGRRLIVKDREALSGRQ
jgi:CRP/FNR family cyclic AMP-dependent transcriptional regulator